MLGRPVSHIIALRHPHRYLFVIVPLENNIDICVYMAFSDSEVHYAAHFPNHLEQDSDSKPLVNVTMVCWQGNAMLMIHVLNKLSWETCKGLKRKETY